jgi:hypothetical protein
LNVPDEANSGRLRTYNDHAADLRPNIAAQKNKFMKADKIPQSQTAANIRQTEALARFPRPHGASHKPEAPAKENGTHRQQILRSRLLAEL